MKGNKKFSGNFFNVTRDVKVWSSRSMLGYLLSEEHRETVVRRTGRMVQVKIMVDSNWSANEMKTMFD